MGRECNLLCYDVSVSSFIGIHNDGSVVDIAVSGHTKILKASMMALNGNDTSNIANNIAFREDLANILDLFIYDAVKLTFRGSVTVIEDARRPEVALFSWIIPAYSC